MAPTTSYGFSNARAERHLGSFGRNGKYAAVPLDQRRRDDSKGNIYTGEVEQAKRIQKFRAGRRRIALREEIPSSRVKAPRRRIGGTMRSTASRRRFIQHASLFFAATQVSRGSS
jgi:hypothetical protein